MNIEQLFRTIWIDAIPNPKLIFPYTLSTFWQLNVTSSMSERISYWPVRHGGTEQGRNHTKESLVVFGSGQAGWVVELTILHETNQTYFKPSNKQICIEVLVTVLSPRTLSSPSLPGRPSTSTLSRFAKLTCAMHRMHGKQTKCGGRSWPKRDLTSGNQSSADAQKLTCCQVDLFKSGRITRRNSLL